MDQELNDRLTKIEKMVSDNNRILTKMRRAQRNAAFIRVLYWIVVIVLAYGAWRVVQPYLMTVTNEYKAVTNAGNTDTSGLMNLIDQYTGTKNTTK